MDSKKMTTLTACRERAKLVLGRTPSVRKTVLQDFCSPVRHPTNKAGSPPATYVTRDSAEQTLKRLSKHIKETIEIHKQLCGCSNKLRTIWAKDPSLYLESDDKELARLDSKLRKTFEVLNDVVVKLGKAGIRVPRAGKVFAIWREYQNIEFMDADDLPESMSDLAEKARCDQSRGGSKG